MQDVEDFKQTNEGNNEEGKKHLHVGTQHSNKNVCLVALKREWKVIFHLQFMHSSLPNRDNFYNQANNM